MTSLRRSILATIAAAGPALLANFFAVPGRASPAPAASASATPPPAPSSAMGKIAARLVSDTSGNAKDAAVFIAPMRSDEPAPRADELAGKLAAMIASGLGGATVRPEPTSLAGAQTLARKSSVLLYLQTEIAGGQLKASADVYRSTRNVWDRARLPAPVPVAHGFASARIDGEVRSYLAPVPLVVGRIDRVPTEEKDLVALACGDVDDDGALEIATLSRKRVALGRVRAGRFAVLHQTALRDLSGIAPTPLREPLGGIAIVTAQGRRAAHVDVGITDRARASRLDGDLRPLRAIAGVPFATPAGDACMQFRASTLAASVAKCADVDPPIDPTDVETELDAAAAASFVTRGGAVHIVQATRDPNSGELRIRSDGRSATLPHVGAQIALADLDQDGAPEIISTLDVLPKPTIETTDDALVITTWQVDGTLNEKTRTPVPAGVRAVAACPPEGGGSAPIVVATQGELWIIR